MATEVDLFGNEVVVPESDIRDRPPINDVEFVRTVLHTAYRAGFVLTGSGRVRLCEDDDHVIRVPGYMDQAVRQLLDTGWLSLGRSTGVHDAGERTTAHAVTVPTSARRWLQRQSTLQTMRIGKD